MEGEVVDGGGGGWRRGWLEEGVVGGGGVVLSDAFVDHLLDRAAPRKLNTDC